MIPGTTATPLCSGCLCRKEGGGQGGPGELAGPPGLWRRNSPVERSDASKENGMYYFQAIIPTATPHPTSILQSVSSFYISIFFKGEEIALPMV